MSKAPKITREYQVAQFTKGVDLPLQGLQRRHAMFISEILVQAWHSLLKEHGSLLYTIPESELNALMESELDQMRTQIPQWAQLVCCVTRGKESITFDGSSLENRPDLSLHLTSRVSRMPLVIECKLIDHSNKKGVNLYCDKGIVRFLQGQYSWYAIESFMMAYVRDKSTIQTTLTPLLNAHTKKHPDPYLTEQLPVPVMGQTQEIGMSKHGRNFKGNPGTITLWHLWLT